MIEMIVGYESPPENDERGVRNTERERGFMMGYTLKQGQILKQSGSGIYKVMREKGK